MDVLEFLKGLIDSFEGEFEFSDEAGKTKAKIHKRRQTDVVDPDSHPDIKSGGADLRE